MKPMNRNLIAGIAVAVVVTITFVSCATFPVATPEDSGNVAFVRQAVPVLHGRKIRGHAEVKLLSDLVGETSRETVLRVLMEQPEFIDHWSETIVDDLRIDREGFMSQNNCYGDPRRAGVPTGALANAILTTEPTIAAAGGAFNMSDVVRSALVADNLYPIFRAHLYALVNRPDLSSGLELAAREILGAKFGETYLNRQMGCLTCHNSETSTSGASSGWNRTYPIWGLLEKALYGASTGEPTRDAFAMFRTDARFDGTLAPWGMQDCGTTFSTALPPDPQNVQAHLITPRGQTFGVHQLQSVLHQGYEDLKADGMRRFRPPALQTQCDFCSTNCAGDTVDIPSAANAAPNAAAVKALLISRCSSCHGGSASLDIPNGDNWANDLISQPSSQKPGETRIIPGMADASYLIKKITNAAGTVGSQMPLGGMALSAAETNQIRAWINGLPVLSACATCSTLDCNQIPQEVAGEDALAFMIAANVVDNTWQEVFGSSMTIDNYFPRTFAQRQVLWNLTEYNFVPNDWSIRDLLVQIMTSNFFSRKPPSNSTQAVAYTLPLIFDPWVEADPRIPPVSDPGYNPDEHPKDHKNSMADAVYRYSARSLTNSVHKALDWTKPARFPSLAAYPNDALMRSIGFYFSEAQPGFQSSDFQGLLNWESVHGICAKPTGVVTDWVDRLNTAVTTFVPPLGEGPPTVGDVAIVMRDWLLSHGKLQTTTPVDATSSEAEAIRNLFGVASLNDPVSGVADVPGKLRKLCGIQLQAPQFQLAGIVDDELGPKPRIRVCNSPTDCSYQQMCTQLAPAIRKVVESNSDSRVLVFCSEDNVSVGRLPNINDWVVAKFCPSGLCGRLIKWLPDIYINPQTLAGAEVTPLAQKKQMPSCKPGAAVDGFEGCGIPGMNGTLGEGDALIGMFAGARVETANDVQLLKHNTNHYIIPQSGYIVQHGDLLVVGPRGTLKLRTEDGKVVLSADQKDRPKSNSGRALPIVVTSPTADPEQDFTLARQNPNPPLDKIHIIMNAARSLHGDAGMALRPEDYKGFKYTAEELETESLRKRGLLPEQLKAKQKYPNTEQLR